MPIVANQLTGSSDLKRESNDFYPTPPYATLELLKKEQFEGSIWECACGDGAISKLLPREKLFSSDLYNRGYGISDLDFLNCNDKKTNNIITNPPYKLAQEFVVHALECTDKKVAMLLKLNFLEGQKRYELFNNTPLKAVYVFSKRLSFDKGNEKGKGNGLLAYAWYIWEHSYKGKPYIDWIL
jgi:hypothetical protein